MSGKKINISIIGTRGIPACYSGFETFAENLSVRLVQRGHSVCVYCRSHYATRRQRTYRGVRLVVLPTIRHKYFDTVAHTFLSVIHVLFTKTDVIYMCNPINSIFMIIPKVFGRKMIINVDGLEWKRRKWNALGKAAFRVSAYIGTIVADAVVADSLAIHDYYKRRFGKETHYISYGAEIRPRILPGSVMQRYGLKERGYVLYVSRLEPENNAHILIEAYEKTKVDIPLVIVGDAPYGKRYIKKLRSTKDKRICFLGAVYDEGYFELLSNAFLYIHGNEVGGTNPALLQAMATGNCVIVNGVDFNREVIADCGFWYEPGNPCDLKDKIEYLFNHPDDVERSRQMAVERIRKHYNWDAVVNKTEELMKRLVG